MRKVTAIGINEPGKPHRVINAKLFRAELDSLPAGKYRYTVEKLRKNKSLPQLGYYYACVIPLSWKLLLDAGWNFTSAEQVDAFWKKLYANTELINETTGEVMEIPALKRDMSTVQMSTFTDEIKKHCAEYLNGFIPDPGEQIKMEL